ncbi:hypothetical protein FD754_018629 [Muntiacus muntjak]|uniref:Lipocalin/cytosolic fatty-acid binding domain-containing protein n=1 Tax=Muntiacus muntjak TaxID=9888 RepID=A0A5N3UXY8_MUNMU|nr:hypothetical protein FD754_018629 [Muntiacus muntjak]
MKVVFLSLLFVVVCPAQEEEVQPSLRSTRDGLIWEQLSGQWKTAYIASSNLEKIKPSGPLRVYLRNFCLMIKRTQHKGKWEHKHVTGIKQDAALMLLTEGKNLFEIADASKNALVAHNNVEENGKKTVLTGLFGLQKFRKLMEEKGIDEKNIMNFIESDD